MTDGVPVSGDARLPDGAAMTPDFAATQLPVRLLLLLDSRSPAGAHNHSGGMEAAVTAGFVADISQVRQFCAGRLATAGLVTAAFAAAACRGWLAGWSAQQWCELDAEFSARTPSPASRAASRTLGSGLRRLLLATVPDQAPMIRTCWAGCAPPAPHQPLVLGAATALVGGSPAVAAQAAALGVCVAPASAAVRLLGLDPYAVHSVLSDLAPEIERCALAADASPAELPACSAPALELLADVHAASEVRLFAS
jgi:urease accessory protein